MIRVLLEESKLLFQDALRLTLEAKEGISVVDTADNGIEAVEKVVQYQPDIILMNFHLTEKDGVQATKEIKEANPETKVILLTSEYEEDNLIKGLIYGADGILHNKIESDSLERAIKRSEERRVGKEGRREVETK